MYSLECSRACCYSFLICLALTKKMNQVSEAARGCAVVNDMLVLAFTWYKTWDTYKLARQCRTRAEISQLLLRDGKGPRFVRFCCDLLYHVHCRNHLLRVGTRYIALLYPADRILVHSVLLVCNILQLVFNLTSFLGVRPRRYFSLAFTVLMRLTQGIAVLFLCLNNL